MCSCFVYNIFGLWGMYMNVKFLALYFSMIACKYDSGVKLFNILIKLLSTISFPQCIHITNVNSIC